MLMFMGLLSARPLWTDDPGKVEAGGLELELGVSEEEGYLQLKHGFERMEMDLGVLADTGGPLGLEIGTKWTLLESVAFGVSWLPSEGSYELRGIAGREVGPCELLANLSFASESRKVGWGLAGGFWLLPNLEVVAELYREDDITPAGGLRFTLMGAVLDLGAARLNQVVRWSGGITLEI